MIRAFLTIAMVFACVLCAGPSEAGAGARTPMGAVIDDVQLPSVAGGKVSILGAASANVLVFFRPDQANHAGTLQALAGCEKELAGKSIRWVALAPARYSPAEAKAAAAAAGFQMPVVIDEGDAVYNLLGVAMAPTVAILDSQHRLVQFQPYTKLNFCEAVMARIRRVLGELDDAGMARALDPSSEMPTGATSAARRDLKLAEMLLKGGNLEKALEVARTGARNDPKSAAAQALIGRILAAKGDCGGATVAFEASLKLDSGDAEARAGKLACADKR